MRNVRDQRYGYSDRVDGPVADALAGMDPALSRTLLEPYFVDWTWMFRDYRNIYTLDTLVTAARLDPHWAADVALAVNATEFSDDSARPSLILDSLLIGLSEPR